MGVKYWECEPIKEHFPDGSIKISDPSGGIYYMIGDISHRENGPAVITGTHRQEWLYLGKRHRLNGPAITYPSGKKEWWVDGYPVTSDFPKWAKDNEIVYPFSKEHETLFKLIWIFS